MSIICTQAARSTVYLVTLPYTLTTDLGVAIPAYHDDAVVETGFTETIGVGGLPTAFTVMQLEQLRSSAATGTIYGAGVPDSLDKSTQPKLNIWNSKAFSGYTKVDPGGLYGYYYSNYAPGTSEPAVNFTVVNSVIPTASRSAEGIPLSRSGMAFPLNAVGLDYNSITGNVGTLVFDGSSETTLATVAIWPLGSDAPPGTGLFPYVCPDPSGNLNYWALFNNSNLYPEMWVVSSSNVDGSGAPTTLTFSATDVNTAICENTNTLGVILGVKPSGFIWYTDLATWNGFQSLPPPVNGGAVVINIAKDFSTYTIDFLLPQPGDTTAESLFADPSNVVPLITYDSDDIIYYMDNDFPGIVLSLPVPSPPTGLTCGPSTTSSVTFEWGAVVGAIGYDVKWQALPAGMINDSTTTSTSLTLTGLTQGTSYQWRVRAQLS